EPRLEDVSSRSIELRITPSSGVQRHDLTVHDDHTTPVRTDAGAVSNDTQPNRAFSSTGSSEVPIFVADSGRARRLQSGYLPAIEDSLARDPMRVADDSSM